MLLELKVKNLALVEDCRLTLGREMNVFTGETGAGKSLLLQAVSMLLGVKAPTGVVRQGASHAEVEGVFDLSGLAERQAAVRDLGFECDAEDSPFLLVRREISPESSKNRIWIQGTSATRKQLHDLLGDWVEISGQHEFLKVGREDYLLQLVDRFGDLDAWVEKYQTHRSAYVEAAQIFKTAQLQESQKVERLDYLRFLVSELEKASVCPTLESEEKDAQQIRDRLANVDRIQIALQKVQSLLTSEDGTGALGLLREVSKELRTLSQVSSVYQDLSQQCETLNSLAVDLGFEVSRHSQAVEADPLALEKLESKISSWNRLKRKFNVDAAGLWNMMDNASRELHNLENSEQHLRELEQNVQKTESVMRQSGQQLHQERLNVISKMNKALKKEVQSLGMPQADLGFELKASENVKVSGLTDAKLLFSANPGVKPESVEKIASGGELSRVMLSLKSLVASHAEVGVYLFDEVDAGVGGETALRVGERLRKLSKHNQVLVVTHLAQVATFAQDHFLVEKKINKSQTQTLIRPLQGGDRQLEVARMLGDTQSKAAKTLAIEMLKKHGELNL